MLAKTTVAVLGATGSIGRATLDVLESLGGPWRAVGLSAHSRLPELVELSQRFSPIWWWQPARNRQVDSISQVFRRESSD
ncbi:MAG: hypothetical protein R3C56_43070 [Pirellulaceae bacterium]